MCSESSVIFTTALQTRKPKHREIKTLARGYVNPGTLASGAMT